MKHASGAALGNLTSLLNSLRELDGIRDRSPGVFYRGAAAFLHFHEDTAGLFADVRGQSGWKRLPVNSPAEHEACLRHARSALTRLAGAEAKQPVKKAPLRRKVPKLARSRRPQPISR
jgi:hypothetical protein